MMPHQLMPISKPGGDEMDAMTVAVDVAKTVFEVAIADRYWHIAGRHRFNRRQFTRFLATAAPTHVLMEACGTAHYWGRCAQRHGHRVTLLPPAYVRPYVRRNKTDRTDAEALLEAARSGQIPSVPVKNLAQQTLVALHRIREQWMTTRTARINTLRGILREQGILLPSGAGPALRALPAILEDAAIPLANPLCRMISSVYEEVRQLERCIGALERELRAVADADPVAIRLREIPGKRVAPSRSMSHEMSRATVLTPQRRSHSDTQHGPAPRSSTMSDGPGVNTRRSTAKSTRSWACSSVAIWPRGGNGFDASQLPPADRCR
jgi:transposase